MATEIAIFPFLPNQRFLDDNGQPRAVLTELLETLSQQPGFQRAFYGHEIENPGVFRLFVTWDTVEAHTAFTKSPPFDPFVAKLFSVADKEKSRMYHASIRPSDRQLLNSSNAPATEVLVIYFPSDYSEAEQKVFEERFEQLGDKAETTWDGCIAFGGGWIEEELSIPDTDGENSKAYAGFIAWSSLKAHADYRETQMFKDTIHLLREAARLKKVGVCHFSGTGVTK